MGVHDGGMRHAGLSSAEETTLTRREFTAPFLIVNTKAYVTGAATLALALIADELAGRFGIATLFTAQHVDLRLVAEATHHLTVTAQHMDALRPGRGMGFILPESLVEAGVGAVVVNHAEHPVSLVQLDATLARAREVGLMTVVCADSDAECRAVAALHPDIMICEPAAQIGTKTMDAGDYAERTTALVKRIDPRILVIQGAGVASGADLRRVLELGADGSGGTTCIVGADDPRAILTEFYSALAEFRDRGRVSAPMPPTQ